MDDVSYFLGAAHSSKQALDLSCQMVDRVLSKNACRGREGGPALNSREIFEMCKELASDEGVAENSLRRQPTYETTKDSKDKERERETKRQATVSKEWNDPGLTRKQRLALICQSFNMERCKLKKCKFAHVCSVPTSGDNICGAAHPMTEHS